MGGLSYDQHKYISIHALREEGDRADVLRKTGIINFYPRPPRGGRPDRKSHAVASDCISILPRREEGDPENAETARRTLAFLSTPSARRATVTIVMELTDEPHFYPRPPRGGRHYIQQPDENTYEISIHALREEGDLLCLLFLFVLFVFLSTPSARRATGCVGCCRECKNISIHALREAGDQTC